VRRVAAAGRAAPALAFAVAVALALALAGCGADRQGSAADGPGRLVISAAASLSTALDACKPAGARISFAGSDELAGQIRQGLRPGVFAAANTTLPEQLHADGLVERPRAFATNELVVAVPQNSDIRALDDLAARGRKLAVGARSVPVGAYTREVLARVGGATQRAIERAIRSEEPDVRGVVGKVTQGAVDAGFVYATDVMAARDRLRAVRLPQRLRPTVRYGAAVVAPSAAASSFVEDLVGGRCQDALRGAGFGAAP
jgi:molybdate transport system substrate-binding protein